MITLTRRELLALKNVLSKSVWYRTPRGLRPPVVFIGSAEGLTIRSHSAAIAVELRCPQPQLERTVRLPAVAISEVAARDDTPVLMEQALVNESRACWIEGDLPQRRSFQVPDSSTREAFPERPATTCVTSSELLAAIDRVGAVTDRESNRYALDHIRLASAGGEIAATDGRQALVESEFEFPWAGERLVTWSPVFSSKEVASHATIEIGAAENAVYFGMGDWSVWLVGSPEARFPKLESVFPAAALATHKLLLSDSDAVYLEKNLSRLPGNNRQNRPIDLVIGEQPVVRSISEDCTQFTELVLSQSRTEGEPIRYSTNRKFLVRALELGFREVAFYPGHRALCESASRRYLWALCEPSPDVPNVTESIRIESPVASESLPATISPKRILPMTSAEQAVKQCNTDRPSEGLEEPSFGSPLEKALAIRAALREALAANYELVAALKRQKRRSRIVETTLASLKELQRIGA